MRIRTLLLLVAGLALAIWGEQMRRRRAYCLQKALEHRTRLYMVSFHYSHRPLAPEDEQKLSKTYPHAAWHLRVSDRYRWCANHPWEAIPEEPPEPFSFPEP